MLLPEHINLIIDYLIAQTVLRTVKALFKLCFSFFDFEKCIIVQHQGSSVLEKEILFTLFVIINKVVYFSIIVIHFENVLNTFFHLSGKNIHYPFLEHLNAFEKPSTLSAKRSLFLHSSFEHFGKMEHSVKVFELSIECASKICQNV